MTNFRKLQRSFKKTRDSLVKAAASRWKSARSALGRLTSFNEEYVLLKEATGIVERKQRRPKNFLNPLFWVKQLAQFSFRYISTRSWIAFVQAVPAMTALLTPLALLTWIAPSQSEVTMRAISRREYFRETGNFESAEFYARQICIALPEDADAVLARAIILEKLDRASEAQALAVHLAETREHVPAMEWLCFKEYEHIRSSEAIDPDRERRLVNWLNILLTRRPQRPQSNLLLGSYFMLRGQYSNAIGPLTVVAETAGRALPEATYSLALAYHMTENPLAAQTHASLAADVFLNRYQNQPFDEPLRRQLLQCLILSAREEQAVRILEELRDSVGFEKDELLKSQLCESYVRWSRRLRNAPSAPMSDIAKSIDCLYRGIALAPTNALVVEELVALACSGKTLEQGQLQIALDSGVAPAIVHFILGTRAIANGDVETGKRELDLAAAHNAELPGLQNNMAEAILAQEKPDLLQALNLVEAALRSLPNHPYLHDTRGKVLLEMGRFQDAIVEFEVALSAQELRPNIHASLARAYDGLGVPAESMRHQQLAERLKDLDSLGK